MLEQNVIIIMATTRSQELLWLSQQRKSIKNISITGKTRKWLYHPMLTGARTRKKSVGNIAGGSTAADLDSGLFVLIINEEVW